ncbi:hypothetical protein H0H92_009678, partial [Tricholoma furcatifolium]
MPDLQNVHMKMTYEGLPLLLHLFELIPYGYDERETLANRNEDNEMLFRHVHLHAIAKMVTMENMISIITGLLFVKHGIYGNPSRLDPDILCSSNAKRLAFKNGGPFNIMIPLEVVTESFLIDALDIGSQAYPKPRQHRCTIILPQQEEHRAISTICQALDLGCNPKATYSFNGWAFTTTGEKNGTVDTASLIAGATSHTEPLAIRGSPVQKHITRGVKGKGKAK